MLIDKKKQQAPSTSTHVDLSSKVFHGIHQGAISQELLMKLIHNICLEITLLKLLPHFQRANELNIYNLKDK